jgi:8-oxo-dGTP diphosphatase
MSRQAVRAIIVKDGNLLVMHRNKFGTEYETLPGGGVEIGEEPEAAIVRELAEETSITISNHRLVFIEEAGNPFGTQLIYLCEYVSGEPKLAEDSEESQINKLGHNLYEPKWVPLESLPKLPFVSEKLKVAIIDGVKNGFPDQVTQIK